MANSIVITFNNPAQAGDVLEIKDSNTPSVSLSLYFDTVSSAFTIAVTGNISQDITSVKTYLENTYNSLNRYIITANYSTNQITVLDNIGNSIFTESLNNTFGRITTTTENEPIYIPVSISSITLLENATDPCNLVDLEITTFEQVTEITSPVIQVVNSNPFTITGINRDSLNSILVSVNDGTSSDADSVFVPVLSSSLFDISISLAPNGSTVTVNRVGQGFDFDIEYSIDNVTFYSSSSFTGLSEGNYTMYIKDSIGCSISIPFEITAFEPNVFERKPYFKISEQNSLITKIRQEIDNVDNFKNPTNTLSYEEETNVNYRNFLQLFQKTDGLLTQQYRSNYENVTIRLHDCEENVSVLLSQQKSNNFNITDIRDIKLANIPYNGNIFVGVQYGIGNTYDPITLSVSGSYNLGTEVPDFMNEDDYIQVEGAGWFRVEDVIYYNGVETLVLEALSNSFPIQIVNQTVKGTSIYNKLEYELFEFEFDLNTLNGNYYITYNATDSEFDELNYRTEWFNVSNEQKRTYLLQYYNSENNETNYSTGIVNKIRIPYINTLTYVPSDTQEVYLTDTNAVNIESTYRDFYSLEIYPIPMAFIRKIGLALSNDRLFLNGLSLLKNSELESERIGLSNLYRLTAQFVRSDYAFTNISDDGSIVLPSGDILGIDDNTEEVLGTKDNQ